MSTKLSLKKKIDSPLAKYNGAGQLFCVLCNAQVKNEMYWTAHLNGKQHRENLVQLKKAPPQSTHVFKRPAPPGGGGDDEPQPPPTKVTRVEQPPPPKTSVELAKEELDNMAVEEESKEVDKEDEPEQVQPPTAPLPAGFFDDPKEDARARGQKFKDPQEAEWEKFVKEIATEDLKSTEMVGIEEQDRAVDRELEGIEEQMMAWQRVIQLEKRAEELGKLKKKQKSVEVQQKELDEQDDEDAEELDYDEEMDWRNKKR